MASSEEFLLSSCTPADIEGMITVYQNAFTSNNLSAVMFPPQTITLAEKQRWLRARFLHTFTQREIRNFKIVERSSGRVAAWIRWGFPCELSEEEMTERQQAKDEWPLGANVEVCEEKFGGLGRMRERWAGRNSYVVYLLSTDPAFQRRGLAKRLLQYGLDLADSEGKQVYIEATRDGHPVYHKLGFRDVDVLTMDLKRWGEEELGVNRIMVRQPRKE